MAASRTSRPPMWRDVRTLAWTFQIAVVGIVVAVVAWLWGNLQRNSDQTNIPLSYDFLDQPAGFPIPGSDFRQAQPVKDAVVEGLLNTIRLAGAGIVLATVVGIVLGVARLSGNFIVRSAARAYVEFVRNVPLLSFLYIVYLAVVLGAFPPPADTWEISGIAVINVRGINVAWFEGSVALLMLIAALGGAAAWATARWRRSVFERSGMPARTGLFGLSVFAVVVVIGWFAAGYSLTTPTREGLGVTGGIEMTPAYFGALVALVVYTSSHIAEITRGSIQAVAKGQGEAANALALSSVQRMWYVILPQAMRIAVPPMGNQYLNLMKNSSLAAVFSFPEVTKIAQLSQSNRSPAVPVYSLTLVIYLGLSLVIAFVVNVINRRLEIVER